jgi:hypothetical protein
MTTPEAPRPLNVRPDIPLSEAQLQSLRVLDSFDLTPVKKRLLKEAVMPSSWVDDAIFEFRRFLGLTVFSSGRLDMMNPHIDRVWHTCLLFTRLYADLCHQAFGHFVHHDPTNEESPYEPGSDPWGDFCRVYEAAYGELTPAWTRGLSQRV